MVLKKKWSDTNNLTKMLSRKRAIILTKAWTELCTLVCCWKYWWWKSIVNFKAISLMVLKKKWIGTKQLHQNSKSKKGHHFYKETLTELCSLVCWWRLWWWISVACFKAISVMVLTRKWISTMNLTKILCRKRAIILIKTVTEFCSLVCWCCYDGEYLL